MKSFAEQYLSEASSLLLSRGKRLHGVLAAEEERWSEPAGSSGLRPPAEEGLLFLMGYHEIQDVLTTWGWMFEKASAHLEGAIKDLESFAEKMFMVRPVRLLAFDYARRLAAPTNTARKCGQRLAEIGGTLADIAEGGSGAAAMLEPRKRDPAVLADLIMELSRLIAVASAAVRADCVCYDPGWDQIKTLCENGHLSCSEIWTAMKMRIAGQHAKYGHGFDPVSILLEAASPSIWFSRTPLCERLIDLQNM